MAHIGNIWVHDPQDKTPTMLVTVMLKPAGEVRLNVDIPKNFMDVIVQMAQTAADAHEAKMRAEILGDQHKLTAIPAQEQTGEGK